MEALKEISLESAGSPPRMWGIYEEKSAAVAAIRFTPTHVGDINSQYMTDTWMLRFTPTHVGDIRFVLQSVRH